MICLSKLVDGKVLTKVSRLLTVLVTSAVTSTSAEPVKLPGIEVDPVGRCVTVDSTICLREGLLELVACAKGGKVHESLLLIEARPLHVHTALLLLGLEPGNPALMERVEGEEERWRHLPPSGDLVEVFLAWKSKDEELIEKPVSEFIVRVSDRVEGDAAVEERLSTHAFLFAGSRLVDKGSGPRVYLGDRSGNLISLATFGDELLCLQGVHSRENRALLWEINTKALPPSGTKVTVRLRPAKSPGATFKQPDRKKK